MEPSTRKINWVPALASFVIPGLGQLMQGRYTWAAIWIILAVVLWIMLFGWVIHILAGAEAAIAQPRDRT
jgi:TM2 domain-containing membrane protein YozV